MPEHRQADAHWSANLLEAIVSLAWKNCEDGYCADAHTPPDGNP